MTMSRRLSALTDFDNLRLLMARLTFRCTFASARRNFHSSRAPREDFAFLLTLPSHLLAHARITFAEEMCAYQQERLRITHNKS